MGFSSFSFPGFLLSGGNCNDSASGSFLFVFFCFLIGLLWFCFHYLFIYFFYACLCGILSFWVFWKSYVLVAKLWFCLIYAATDVCSWDFVVFEFNCDGVMWFLILFCSIMLFLNSNYFGVYSS